MKKRVLAALLALVMLFGALPMSVFAEDLETVEGPSGTFGPDEPEKYTYHLFHDFNYEGGSRGTSRQPRRRHHTSSTLIQVRRSVKVTTSLGGRTSRMLRQHSTMVAN